MVTMSASKPTASVRGDTERLARLYFSLFQGMAIQARDGASTDDLSGVVRAAMEAWPGRG